ncbi:proepiregulin-like [Simochromis diagramma]|uniref:proepiregulin-like n=1 Tax=Simochromis diagramma TaxID=43689 RepID=UPI001A7EE47C|nr:proepiregulin-like [Simochromis diagramma]
MGISKLSVLLSIIGVMMIWPYVLTESASPRVPSADGASLPAGQGEKQQHVVKWSMQNCESAYDNYCLNNGQCILLVDINEHHCKCETGFIGSRCEKLELVLGPEDEKQIIIIIFFMILLIIGLAGALYLFCRWYEKNSFRRQLKRQGYKGVEMA